MPQVNELSWNFLFLLLLLFLLATYCCLNFIPGKALVSSRSFYLFSFEF